LTSTAAAPSAEGGEGALQGVDLAQVAGLEADLGALPPHFVGERAAARGVDVDEADPRALGSEGAHDLGADPRRAAGDEHHGVLEARVDGEGHLATPIRVRQPHRSRSIADRRQAACG
jgi:hypothetical protein